MKTSDNKKAEEYNSEKNKKIWEKCLKYNCFIGLITQKNFTKLYVVLRKNEKAVPIGLKKTVGVINF